MATYNPTVADNSGAIRGQGITSAVDTFGKYFLMGLQHNQNEKNQAREDARWEKAFGLQQDQFGLQREKFAQDSAMEEKRFGLEAGRTEFEQNKFELSQQEEADFAAGAWEGMKARTPGIITPEMDAKFYGGSLGAKRGLVLGAQAAEARMQKQQDRQTAQTITPVPMGKGTAYFTGNGALAGTDEPPAAGPGFVDMGNGVGVMVGPDGKPVNPDNLIQMGPAGGGGNPGDMLPSGPGQTPQFNLLFPGPQQQPRPPLTAPIRDGSGNVTGFRLFDPITGQPLENGKATDPYAPYLQ